MKKSIWLLAIILITIACKDTKEDTPANFTLTGSIKGLKKGTLYLKKIKDTSFTILDSIALYNNAAFTLKATLEEPEVLYLYLDKLDNNVYNDFLAFFAEPGTATVHTKLQKFRESARITGAKNQTKFNEYRTMKKRFDMEHLRLMNINYEAHKQNDLPKLQETEKAFKSNAIRKYLYTVNFAVSNKHLEIAPYIILSEIPDAGIKYLDTVMNVLGPNVSRSKYGKELRLHIQSKKVALKANMSKE